MPGITPELREGLLTLDDEFGRHSYSGADIAVYAHTTKRRPGGKNFFEFGTLNTLSISTMRSHAPVRVVGETYPRAYTRGARTIAGSMVFNFIKDDVLNEMIAMDPDLESNEPYTPDKLPLFNVLVQCNNEYGDNAVAELIGVTLVNSGVTLSVNDIFTEAQYTFVALGLTPFRTVAQRKNRLGFNTVDLFTSVPDNAPVPKIDPNTGKITLTDPSSVAKLLVRGPRRRLDRNKSVAAIRRMPATQRGGKRIARVFEAGQP